MEVRIQVVRRVVDSRADRAPKYSSAYPFRTLTNSGPTNLTAVAGFGADLAAHRPDYILKIVGPTFDPGMPALALFLAFSARG